MRSTANAGAASMAQDIPSSTRLAGPALSKEQGQSPGASGRSKEKKPPPPPRSHHGKRISATADTVSSTGTTPPRSTSRPSYQAERSTSARGPGTPSASSISQPPPQEYFSVSVGASATNDTPGSLSRSDSQQKRPPTPPLSRRHSQMQRSKSTQSKSSGSRLTISSDDSEDDDSSQPSSPGPTYRPATSQARKRASMPPPSSGEIRAATHSPGFIADSSPSSTQNRPPQPGQRASSHGHIMSGSSSTVPPPPPPPRRARDPNTRYSDGGSASRMTSADEFPPPQPSNAHDILADLSRLQKEVDDLRGHYEERKVSH